MLGPIAGLALIAMGTLPADESASRLAGEVRTRGWIVYSARSEQGDWDLFACRPDGSGRAS